VELVHEILRDQVRPSNLVHGVAEHGQEDVVAQVVEVVEDRLVDL